MPDEYSIIIFYVLFMIAVNVICLGFSQGIVSSANYLDSQNKAGLAIDATGALGYILTGDVPTSSNIYATVSIIRFVYIIVMVYSLVFLWILVNWIRGR
jgi:hypothetical protein